MIAVEKQAKEGSLAYEKGPMAFLSLIPDRPTEDGKIARFWGIERVSISEWGTSLSGSLETTYDVSL
jgi:hypothetical protein